MHDSCSMLSLSRSALIALLLALAGCAGMSQLEIFPSIAIPASDGSSWQATVRGRLAEPITDDHLYVGLVHALAQHIRVDPHNAVFKRRAGLLLSDTKSQREVTLKLR